MSSSIENRPYAGTWKLNQKKIVQHTPDVLVYINGDTSVSGCSRCKGRIDIQQFITGLNVEASVDSGGHSATVTLSIPKHHENSLIRDGQFILKPGLELHIYMRGYFPVKDMYQSLNQKQVNKGGQISQQTVLEKFELDGLDLEDIPNYPYYHVFHGVVTQTDSSYSSGFYTGNINASSMMYFWQYQNISENASLFGARPSNSKLKLSIVGHNFTKMTPFEIIYTLFHDVAGAASEVGFALSSKTNQTAKSTVVDKSLFSINLEYWKKRFDTRMMNLRIHGVSGEVFNAAQSAFLGRLSTRQTTRILRGRFAALDQSTNTQNFLSSAKALGFFGERAAQRLAFLEKSSPTKKNSEINIGMMQAFATDISAFGQINFWESTYQTKQNIADQVKELTGYEFYQDVDGDFVFKPPLYNLDTSSSRVYRIEDIDIISINQSEKEPTVTFMTIKGSHFKNLRGLGMENQWGVRGQYIDYRLVAQFGWRPGSLEVNYLNDPKSMFFASINRMDIMNSDIKSGSVTIPLRPEMRPGYPVYIPHLDCFYYVRSFSHSFQFGGQCTTSIQLTAKRGKFFPPGNPEKDGIQAISLGSLISPQRPLLGVGEGGKPKYYGFPNVVMSLDPNNLNPLYFVVGSDIEDISDPQTLENFVKKAQSFGLVSKDETDDKVYVFHNGNNKIKFSLDTPSRRNKGNSKIIDLKLTARKFTQNKRIRDKKIISQNKKLGRLNQKILREENKRLKQLNVKNPNQNTISKIESKIKNLQKELKNLRETFSRERKKAKEELEKNSSTRLLVALLRSTKNEFLSQNKDYQNMNSTANLLDLLSDKKASVSNGKLPGSYRYYSASHPTPADQGIPQILFSEEKKGKIETRSSKVTNPTPVKGGGFKNFSNAKEPLGFLPEIEIDPNHKATRGIRILSNDPKNPEKVVTTDQIRTLSFAVNNVKRNVYLTDYKIEDSASFLSDGVKGQIFSVFKNQVNNAFNSKNIREGFRPVWDSISKWGSLIPGTSGPSYPLDKLYVPVPGFSTTAIIATDQPNNTIKTDLSYKEILKEAGKNESEKTRLGRAICDYLSREWYQKSNAILQRYFNSTVKPSLEKANNRKASRSENREASEKYKNLKFVINSIYEIAEGAQVGLLKSKIYNVKKRTRAVERNIKINSPVFPVSDAKGYEVIGNYQYGRDVDIDPQGSMHQLYNLDLFKFADRFSLENYVNSLMGKPVTIRVKEGNKYREYKVTGPTSLTEAQKQMQQSILRNPNAVNVLNRLVSNSKYNATSAGQLDVALSNWIADHREGIAKISVNNAAFSLADLQNHVKKKVCSCKTADAEIVSLSFSQDKFVNITNKSNPRTEGVTQWLQEQIEENKGEYIKHQDLLRGSLFDRRNSSLVETFKKEISRFAQNTNEAQRGAQEITDQVRIAALKALGLEDD